MRVTERLASLFIDESLRDREVLAEAQTSFSSRSWRTPGGSWWTSRRSSRTIGAVTTASCPISSRPTCRGANTEMQVQALVDSINRDKDRHLVLERAIADATAAEAVAPPPAVVRPAPDGRAAAAAAQDALQALQLRLAAAP